MILDSGSILVRYSSTPKMSRPAWMRAADCFPEGIGGTGRRFVAVIAEGRKLREIRHVAMTVPSSSSSAIGQESIRIHPEKPGAFGPSSAGGKT